MSAAAMSVSPAAETVRVPSRVISAGASREVGSMVADMGSMLSAEISPESPRMNCRYCKAMKMNPNRAKNCMKIDRLPAARPRWAKTRGSSIGLRRLRSHRTKPARTATPAASPASVRTDSHPWLGASMMEYTSATMPITASTAPLTSRRGALGAADSGTKRMVATRAAVARTTFSPNTDGHDHTSRRIPEASSPSTAAPPATAAQTLTARVRCSTAKVAVIVDSVAGMTRAAPQSYQLARGVSGHGHRRAGREDRQACDQRQPAAVAVADSPSGQQQRGEHQGIGIDDPRQLGLGGVDRQGDVGQRHIQ